MKLQARIIKSDGCGWYCYSEADNLNDAKENLLEKLHLEFNKREEYNKCMGAFARHIYYPSTIKVVELQKKEDASYKNGYRWITKRGGIKLKLIKHWVKMKYSNGIEEYSYAYYFDKN